MSEEEQIKLQAASAQIDAAMRALHTLNDMVRQSDGLTGSGLYELIRPHEDRLCEGLEMLNEVALSAPRPQSK